VLRHLIDHAGRLVRKSDLLDVVWRGTVVSEAALTSCIRDLRRALTDSSRVPRYIETVHRRGFRFIGPLVTLADRTSPRHPPAHHVAGAATGASRLFGRDAELVRLHEAFAAVRAGGRRVVFVTGEPGIGKTALLEEFLDRLPRDVRVGRGQCVEQFGAGEAYLPILDALARLGRAPDGERLIATLRRYAPAWLAHLPGLLGDADLADVQRRAQATTRERTLREVADALDVLGADMPLVLALEDLHWSDSATVDLLSVLARRRDPAHVLVVGTYRPADVAAAAHPLQAMVRELRVHGCCDEIALDFLPEGAIRDYLEERFPAASFVAGLAPVLERSTSGNPLFLVSVVEDLIEQGSLREVDGRWTLAVPVASVGAAAPPTLRDMVEKHIDRLGEHEREILEIASLIGAEFTALLAAPKGMEAQDAEVICAALARQGRFVRAAGIAEWPDGTVAARFQFIHALYQTVLHDRVPVGSGVGLHLRIGTRLESAYGARSAEIAGELALHFERGRDFERAVRHRRAAADAALRRHAHREAADHARRGLQAASIAAGSADVAREELALCMILGAALIAGGWASPDVARTYARAHELCSRLGAAPEGFSILIGLFGYYVTRAELAIAGDLARQMLAMAAPDDDAAVVVGAHNAAGMVALYEGDLVAALGHLELACARDDAARHSPIGSPVYWGGQDVGVTALCHVAWALWMRGFPDRAAARLAEGVALARALDHPFTTVFAWHFAAIFHQARGDVAAVRELDDAPALREHELGIEMLSTLSAVRHGWLLCEQGRGTEGIAAMREGIAAFRGHGAGFGIPTYLALLAEACGRIGRASDGLDVVREAQAFAARTGAHYWDAELERLAGELLAARAAPAGSADAVEAHLVTALELARRQGAKLLELRAATSLARHLQSCGARAKAAAVLRPVLDGFDEGLATRDLHDAAAVLRTLARGSRRS
jgi:predicted ATPase